MGKFFCSVPILQRANIQNLQRTKTELQEKNKQTHLKVSKGHEQMEKHSMFMARKNQYHENGHTAQDSTLSPSSCQ